METGKRVKAIRELRGYSQDYVALKLGIAQQSYSAFERKASDKRVYTLMRVAEILNVDVCLFFALDIPINKETITLNFSDLYKKSKFGK
jgi:transcriptional regulator with XRE-family HTH domain